MPSDLIALRDGPVVLVEAIQFYVDLERRLHVCTARDGVLHVTRRTRLSAEDIVTIHRLKRHILALVGYCEVISSSAAPMGQTDSAPSLSPLLPPAVQASVAPQG